METTLTLIHSNGRPNLNAPNGLGQTPMMLALSTGRGNAILDILITAGADTRRRDQVCLSEIDRSIEIPFGEYGTLASEEAY